VHSPDPTPESGPCKTGNLLLHRCGKRRCGARKRLKHRRGGRGQELYGRQHRCNPDPSSAWRGYRIWLDRRSLFQPPCQHAWSAGDHSTLRTRSERIATSPAIHWTKALGRYPARNGAPRPETDRVRAPSAAESWVRFTALASYQTDISASVQKRTRSLDRRISQSELDKTKKKRKHARWHWLRAVTRLREVQRPR